MGYPSEPASEIRRHPLYARLYRWTSATAEARGQSNLRRRLLSGLCGRVIEIGAGSGLNFPFYPTSTTEVVAVEPEPYLRQVARGAAGKAPVRVTVIGGIAERLPVPDASFDAGVVSLVLCSVPDARCALGELYRVIRCGGELRFYEHVLASAPGLASLQRAVDRFVWPRLSGGCHPARETEAVIREAGFVVRCCDRFDFRPSILMLPETPRILGTAVHP